jgi:hypothetical protein
MKRRPWPIVILAFLQIFCEPVSNFLLSAHYSHMTPACYWAIAVAQNQWLALSYILLLPVVMGASVYAMKRWSYGIFVAGATWMLFRNLQLDNVATISFPIFVSLYLGNIAFVGYFLLPKVVRPFINKQLRWWETKPRFIVNFMGRVVAMNSEAGSEEIRLLDLAEGGCFIASVQPLNVNKLFELRFSTDTESLIALKGRTVFSRKLNSERDVSATAAGFMHGYGFQFTEIAPDHKKSLAAVLQKLQKAKAPQLSSATNSKDDFLNWLKDLRHSRSGLVPQLETRPPVPSKPEVATPNVYPIKKTA